MSGKGCNNCANYKRGEIKVYTDDIPRSCLLGNNEQLESWWSENGKKTNSDQLTDMDCFKETVLGEFCNKTHEILDELKIIVDKQR